MNYVKNFYNGLKIIANEEEEVSQLNIPLKINKKYLIKNAILYPVFKDEFKIFKQQKHNKYFKNLRVSHDNYNKNCISNNSDNNTNYELEKDKIMYTAMSFNYDLNKDLNEELNKDLNEELNKDLNEELNEESSHDVNLKKYEIINECIERFDNLEIQTVCESDEEQINEDKSLNNDKKNQLKNILKNNLLIAVLLSCYYLKTKFER